MGVTEKMAVKRDDLILHFSPFSDALNLDSCSRGMKQALNNKYVLIQCTQNVLDNNNNNNNNNNNLHCREMIM